MGQSQSVPSENRKAKYEVNQTDDQSPSADKGQDSSTREISLTWTYQETFVDVEEEFVHDLMLFYVLQSRNLRSGNRRYPFEKDLKLVERHINADILQRKSFNKSAVYQWLVIAWMLKNSAL